MQIKVKLNGQAAASHHEYSIPQALSETKTATRAKTIEPDYSSLEELKSLIGLDSVKETIYEIQAFARIQQIRKAKELAAEPVVLHAVFKGNPGTGKTTVARLLAGLYHEMGILSRGQIIEAERADLVGEYIGHTALKTKEQVKRALGGVLFVDEAYSLCRGGEKDFGREAIDVLVKAMEDYKDDFILILAGYTREMNEFFSINPGLASRVPLHIEFPDYSVAELLTIAKQMYRSREYKLDTEGSELLKSKLERARLLTDANFGNARTVRNIMEASLRMQAKRLIRTKPVFTNDVLQYISAADIDNACSEVLKADIIKNAGTKLEQTAPEHIYDFGGKNEF